MRDVLLAKAEIIERSLIRVELTYQAHAHTLHKNYDAQDVIVLNLQRACEAAIDMAMHLVREHSLGLPKSSNDAFSLLEAAGIIPRSMENQLKRMVGFRNIAVHDYHEIDWNVVHSIVKNNLNDIRSFSSCIISGNRSPTI